MHDLTKTSSTGKAADDLDVSRTTVWRWIQAHPGLAVLIGGRNRVHNEAIKLIGRGTPLAEAARLVSSYEAR